MHENISSGSLLACAVEAARTAGRHAARNRDRRGAALQRFQHDVKLELDLECQEIAEACVRRHFPGHATLGEEDTETGSASAPGRAGYEWIIDPIDGTVNFSHGFPFWCCSVAVRRAETVLAGAVYAPALDRLYTATLDGPALLNERPLNVSRTADPAAAMVMTGMDKNVVPGLPPYALVTAMAMRVQKIRVAGSAALDLCLVGSGAADAYVEAGIYIWDVAAGGLIVRRAGGLAEVTAELPGGRLAYVAGNARLQPALKALVRGVMEQSPGRCRSDGAAT